MQMIIQSMPPAPAIVVITSDAARQIMIVVEKEILVECHDMATALLDLISAYFSFDIAYPKPLYPVFLFIQHFMFGVVDEQPRPNAVSILYSTLNNV